MTLMATEKPTQRIKWYALTSGCWHTESWDMVIERKSNGWALREPERSIKTGFRTLADARSWAQDWRDGKVRP